MGPHVRCVTRGPDDTRAVGEAIAPVLLPGDVVSLSGDLGAGKTAFVQGAARGLGVEDRVTSPTFVIVREYEGRVPVLHIDVYRLSRVAELMDLGYEEYLDPSSVVFIEWGPAVESVLPRDWLHVEILGADRDEREIRLHGHGPEWARRFEDLSGRVAQWCKGAA
jgi:tRNA threonylcarbamoyladenosine biosynthesis protein TsaE